VGEAHGMARATMRQELADRILTAIAVGAYSPGDRLPSERELAELQGVSRVTVREALKIVSQLGLLSARRGREGGNFVTALGVQAAASERARRTLERELPKLTEFFDYRCLVEGLVARTAAERHTPEQAAELRALLAQFRVARDSEPYPEDYLERARIEHTELVGAVLQRNCERAYEAAHHHFRLTLEIMKDGLRRLTGE
jgi:GntR family transcriptional repressor for pyruvate dehydrogenase complex